MQPNWAAVMQRAAAADYERPKHTQGQRPPPSLPVTASTPLSGGDQCNTLIVKKCVKCEY